MHQRLYGGVESKFFSAILSLLFTVGAGNTACLAAEQAAVAPASGFNPVAMITVIAPRQVLGLETVLPDGTGNAAFYADRDVDASIDSNGIVSMRSGQALLSGGEAALVRTPVCSVYASGSSIMSISCDQDVTCVSNLHDTHYGTVQIKVGTRDITLYVGQQAVIATRSEKLGTVLCNDKIKRRRPQLLQPTSDTIMLIGEYDPASLLKQSTAFKRLAHSDLARQRAIASGVMKSVASYYVATISHGQFAAITP